MTIKSLNPDRPSDVVFEFEQAEGVDVGAAVSNASNAFAEWSRAPATVRGNALDSLARRLTERSEELTSLMTREVGKPITEARAEVARAIAICKYYAQIILAPDGDTYPAGDGRSLLMSRRFPVGVCGLITPWNFPVAIPIWKLAPAIGYANSVVLKPAPSAAATCLLLHEIATQELPPGVFEVVLGDAETGTALVSHPGVAAVSFTGSVSVGRSVAERASRRGARFQCEMGGQNASVVLADANLDAAAAAVTYAAMGYAGQKCTATSRIIVEQPVYDDMRDRLTARIESLIVTDPTDESCVVGPVIDSSARHVALDAIDKSKGRIITGGESLLHDGSYVAPTLAEVDVSDFLAQEEVFAPVAAMIPAASPSEAIQIANTVRYGLVASVFTSTLEVALDAQNRLEVGLLKVNAPTSGVDYHAPFGGSKDSSAGVREQGLAAREFYTESRTIQFSP
jgi:aldehyde dehydrogenase (NAD+)